MPMGLKEIAQREAVLKALTELVNRAYDLSRAETQRALDAAHQELGVDRLRLVLPDGTPLATTSRVSPRPRARITAPDAFLSWVRSTHPSEVVERAITEANAAFTARILKEMSAAGQAEIADPETGELHSVPGVSVRIWDGPGHTVRLAAGAEHAVAAAWRSGQLTHLDLPQLTTAGV